MLKLNTYPITKFVHKLCLCIFLNLFLYHTIQYVFTLICEFSLDGGPGVDAFFNDCDKFCNNWLLLLSSEMNDAANIISAGYQYTTKILQ